MNSYNPSVNKTEKKSDIMDDALGGLIDFFSWGVTAGKIAVEYGLNMTYGMVKAAGKAVGLLDQLEDKKDE